MSIRKFATPLLLLAGLLSGCGAKDDPQARLEAAVQQLQDNIEGKKTAAVLDQLHGEFRAQQTNDRDWARRTMTLLFLRHNTVKVLALNNNSRVDPTYRDKGYTDAQVALTGAEGLIPDSARHYAVKLEWWQDDDEWKLARLQWQ
ncbi:hypothetical protein BVH03_03265 [Pseudomonas sp. PA15(2017)]|uniref:hypothetical protein n=1 Tax=Pseudomonas sp. PA15(2017) TaxID=1932111 RepID=UPI00096648A9|nr:hypothetical protein [Pseudomonas sp. PA15(2017)]OLU34199.1 hypothetical protein BVH03_03265 [Pseudomonas sp. PA15(2017)]